MERAYQWKKQERTRYKQFSIYQTDTALWALRPGIPETVSYIIKLNMPMSNYALPSNDYHGAKKWIF